MNEDELAFIQNIAMTPDDDTPRLIFADYLDETGEPLKMARAEYIRADIRGRSCPDPVESAQGQRRALELFRKHSREWWAELPTVEGAVWGWLQRGFAEHLVIRADILVRLGAPTFFGVAPLTSLDLTRCYPESVERICLMPELERIRHLKLQHLPDYSTRLILGGWAAKALADCPYLKNLRELQFVPGLSRSSEEWRLLTRRFPPSIIH